MSKRRRKGGEREKLRGEERGEKLRGEEERGEREKQRGIRLERRRERERN